MSEQQPRILDDEVDLEQEDVRDSQGRRIDADYIDRAVTDARARRGRPSMSTESPSPHVSFRVPDQVRRRLDERARAEGRSASDIARDALERYLTGEDLG